MATKPNGSMDQDLPKARFAVSRAPLEVCTSLFRLFWHFPRISHFLKIRRPIFMASSANRHRVSVDSHRPGMVLNKVKTVRSDSTTTVVAEQRFGHWLAWFEHSPSDKFAAESYFTAVTLLLDSAGWDRSLLESADIQVDSRIWATDVASQPRSRDQFVPTSN